MILERAEWYNYPSLVHLRRRNRRRRCCWLKSQMSIAVTIRTELVLDTVCNRCAFYPTAVSTVWCKQTTYSPHYLFTDSNKFKRFNPSNVNTIYLVQKYNSFKILICLILTVSVESTPFLLLVSEHLWTSKNRDLPCKYQNKSSSYRLENSAWKQLKYYKTSHLQTKGRL